MFDHFGKKMGFLLVCSFVLVFAAACGGEEAAQEANDENAGNNNEGHEAEADNNVEDNGNNEEANEGGQAEEAPAGQLSIQGSDTMVNLGQAWAEVYMDEVNQNAGLSVTGGGSGTGIAALINDDVDIAQVSRDMSEEELQEAADNDVEAHKFIVGQDGLAVFLHPDNPVQEYTVAELKAIFSGEITDWAEFGWDEGGEIAVYSRQDNSGTYVYFHENIVDGEDWAPGTQFMPGSSAVAESVAQEPNAIGYSGVGYIDEDEHNAALVALDEDSEYVTPLEEENINNGDYPIARPLHFYTNGMPEDVTLHYLNWVLKSDEAEEVLNQTGFYGIGDYQEENQALYDELGLDW